MSVPRKILVCFDKFKGTLPAEEINRVVKAALVRKYQEHFGRCDAVKISCVPLSDGGDGFLPALKTAMALETVSVTVTGPLGEPIKANYGKRGDFAVVEMAEASGIALVPVEKLNPLNATCRGTGELIKHAYESGCRRLLFGVGGSATSDGGLSALHALGASVSLSGSPTPSDSVLQGSDLLSLSSIQLPEGGLLPGLDIDIACDVTNPFVGPSGAVYTFGGQKGATDEMKTQLEAGMVNLARILKETTGVDVSDTPGAGAAGGISGTFAAVFGSRLRLLKGSEAVAAHIGLENAIKESDLVITGEGSYDATTAHGKIISLVQSLIQQHNKPIIVLCGRKDIPEHLDHHVYDLVTAFGVEAAMTKTAACLETLTEQHAQQFFGLMRPLA